MTSFASIDRVEGEILVLEVEMLPFEQSKPEDFASKETVMLDVERQQIPTDIEEVNEGDILVVEHNGQEVSVVYYKDEEERVKRIEMLTEMWK